MIEPLYETFLYLKVSDGPFFQSIANNKYSFVFYMLAQTYTQFFYHMKHKGKK